MNIIHLDSFEEKCTGCTACQEVCSFNAITMTQNSEGFYYPAVNGEKCVDCGNCITVCQINKNAEVSSPISITIAHAGDESVRKNGSSGGLMKLLAEEILKQNGIVYGAVFDDKSKTVCHASTENVPLERILRSKYVQSDLGDTYSVIKGNLQADKAVLFCGTPCQVYGLKSFLGRDYENLYTVDFFCHGVPSPGVFRDMIQDAERKQGQSVCDITFRDKKLGWRNLHIFIYFSNGECIIQRSIESPYYFFFLRNYTLRRSCYLCKYYNRHVTDITLADYWAVKEDDDKGISLILANANNGIELLDKVSDKLIIMDKPSFIDFDIYEHKYDVKNRSRFYKKYASRGTEYVFRAWFNREKARYITFMNIKKQILRLLGREK